MLRASFGSLMIRGSKTGAKRSRAETLIAPVEEHWPAVRSDEPCDGWRVGRVQRLAPTDAEALAGVTVFELARVMGTSVGMIEHHYGALIDGAHAGIVGRLDAIEMELEEAATEKAEGGER